jgi:O-antigen/teichoic acid export membrane protein
VGYGLYALANLTLSVLQNIDGGLQATASRYLGISAGRGDRALQSRQLVTLALLALAITGVIGVAMFVAAPTLCSLITVPHGKKGAAIFAARCVALILPLGAQQAVFTAVLQSHARFGVVSALTIASRAGYVLAVVVAANGPTSFQILMALAVAQQLALLVLSAPLALRYVAWPSVGLLSRREIRAILAYAARVQAAGVGAIINLQIDGLIIAAILPVRYVGLYGAGALVATQIRTLPLNAAQPLMTRLGQVHGACGGQATAREFQRLQNAWVLLVTGFASVLLGASAFQIQAWLGPHFLAAGIVCVLLMIGNAVNLLTAVMTIYLQVIGRPEIEVRYGAISSISNVALTVSAAVLGFYAVVGATAVGQVLGSLALLPLARRALSANLPSFVHPHLLVPAGVAAALTAGIAWGLLHLISFTGPVALLVVSFSLLPGSVAFLWTALGSQRLFSAWRSAVRSRTLTPLLQLLYAYDGAVACG